MKFPLQFKIFIEFLVDYIVSLFHIFLNIAFVTFKKAEKPQNNFGRFLATQRTEINASSFRPGHEFGILESFP